MLTEVNQIQYGIFVNGRLVQGGIPSRMIAEATVMNLSPSERICAEIRQLSSDGRQMLMG